MSPHAAGPEDSEAAVPEAQPNSNGPEDAAGKDRIALLEALSAGKLDTLQERVAWLLNHYPDTRDSDVTLQIRFWQRFQADQLHGEYVPLTALYSLTRLTSLARARAKIQNDYKLFLASKEVRAHRGTLEEAERDRAREQQITTPLYTVYADESGKTGTHLIVGSLWVLHAPETPKLYRELEELKDQAGFEGELHFKDISEATVSMYIAAADYLLAASDVVSFKALTIPRAGLGRVDAALSQLYYLLVVQGITHEHESARAPLPRRLQLWKDAEEKSRDTLMLADLEQKLLAVNDAEFGGDLAIEGLYPVDSRGNPLIQMADLFTSSVNRVMNVNNRDGSHPKDRFAQHLLGELGIPEGPSTERRDKDVVFCISL